MTRKTVEKYHLGYNRGTKQFYFYYQLQGDATVTQIFAFAQDSSRWPTCSEMKGLSVSTPTGIIS